ncbi:MAG: hotdog fold thioesterase [Bacteroidia bacterium]|nr:hotdog fold thioesterase [Bacteroidia bacterium]
MTIWFDKEISVDKLKPIGNNTMSEWLGIEWTEIGKNFLKAKMPVDHRTIQDYGILHGGASCVLAETIGSIGSYLIIDHTKFFCVGLEINANHIRTAREGYVTGIATPIHIGGSTHVWDIKIFDEKDKLVCVSRLTVAILARKD